MFDVGHIFGLRVSVLEKFHCSAPSYRVGEEVIDADVQQEWSAYVPVGEVLLLHSFKT